MIKYYSHLPGSNYLYIFEMHVYVFFFNYMVMWGHTGILFATNSTQIVMKIITMIILRHASSDDEYKAIHTKSNV